MDGILSLWQQPSVLLFLTLAVYALALILRARTGYLLLNPVLISTVTLIAYLKILDIDYAVYHDAAQFIDFWLKPAVVALAVPLYQNRQKIFSQWLPVIVSQLAGSVTGIITGMYFAKWLGAEREVVLSLASVVPRRWFMATQNHNCPRSSIKVKTPHSNCLYGFHYGEFSYCLSITT